MLTWKNNTGYNASNRKICIRARHKICTSIPSSGSKQKQWYNDTESPVDVVRGITSYIFINQWDEMILCAESDPLYCHVNVVGFHHYFSDTRNLSLPYSMDPTLVVFLSLMVSLRYCQSYHKIWWIILVGKTYFCFLAFNRRISTKAWRFMLTWKTHTIHNAMKIRNSIFRTLSPMWWILLLNFLLEPDDSRILHTAFNYQRGSVSALQNSDERYSPGFSFFTIRVVHNNLFYRL